MTQKIYEQGDVKVTLLEIKSRANGGKIQVLDQVKGVFIYEDMTQPTMMAEFKFDDRINLLHDLPIVGEEDITIEFVTPGLRPVTMTFQTTSLEGLAVQDNVKGHVYTIKAVSKEHFVSARNNIRHSFRGTIDEMVDNIITTYMESSKPREIDPCKGNQTMVVPFLPPLVAIDMLRKRAVHSSYPSSAFVFFENQDGFNFKCLESFLSKKDPGTRIFNYADDTTSDSTAEARSFRTILEYEDVSRVDTNLRIEMGGLYAKVRSYDFIKKKTDTIDVKYDEKFPGFEKSDSKNKDQITSSTLKEHGQDPATQYFVPRDSSANENYIPDMIGQRMMFTSFMNQQTIRVLINGDSALKVGQIIELNLPEPTGTTGRKKEMKLTSGLYLIKTLCHIITIGGKNKHNISMDCVKLGYSV